MFGSRLRHLRLNDVRAMNTVRHLVVLLYCFAMAFIVSSAILQSGLELVDYQQCFAAIIICLVFYVGAKVLMYLFLVERAHTIRAPYKKRSKDYLWLASMVLVIVGFGVIAIMAFVWPVAEISTINGKCYIGLPFKVTAPLLIYDIGINIAFTVLFLYLLWPLVKFQRQRSGQGSGDWPQWLFSRKRHTGPLPDGKADMEMARPAARPTSHDPANERFMRTLRKLVWKTVIGGTLVMIPTVANLVVLFVLNGHEQGWLCLTICTLDVTWQVCIVHVLTTNAHEIDDDQVVRSNPNPRRPGTQDGHGASGRASRVPVDGVVPLETVTSYIERFPVKIQPPTERDTSIDDGHRGSRIFDSKTIVKTTSISRSSTIGAKGMTPSSEDRIDPFSDQQLLVLKGSDGQRDSH